MPTESKIKVKKKIVKKENVKVEHKKIIVPKVQKLSRKQKAMANRRAILAKKGRQTKWAPVWAVLKKHGMGKRVHPSAMTAYRRSWRRTKLHIKPRVQRKSHFG